MAINPSNSNAISVNSLPQAQLAVANDLLILQTSNGTQTITFGNFNAVKTDVNGNATVPGSLSGNDAYFADVLMNNVSGAAFFSNNGPGIDASNDFYDRFTVQSGIVLSASSNPTVNPIYKTIVNTIIPSVTSYMLQIFHEVADEAGVVTIYQGNNSATVSVAGFFDKYTGLTLSNVVNLGYFTLNTGTPYFDISNSSIQALANAANAISSGSGTVQSALTSLVTVVPSLSTASITPCIIPNSITTGDGGSSLVFQVGIPYRVPQNITVGWRVLVTGTSIY